MEELRGIVNLNERVEITCFCYELEYLQGKCPCREQYDCPMAIISMEVIPDSRPSDAGQKKAVRKLREVKRETDKIKAGLAKLEAAVKKNRRFRI